MEYLSSERSLTSVWSPSQGPSSHQPGPLFQSFQSSKAHLQGTGPVLNSVLLDNPVSRTYSQEPTTCLASPVILTNVFCPAGQDLIARSCLSHSTHQDLRLYFQLSQVSPQSWPLVCSVPKWVSACLYGQGSGEIPACSFLFLLPSPCTKGKASSLETKTQLLWGRWEWVDFINYPSFY